MGEVAGFREDLEPAPRDALVRRAGMPHGDERVVFAPHDQGREALGEIEALVRDHALAREVHDAADRLDERPAGRGLLERGEAAPGLVEVGARLDAQATHAPDEGAHAATGRRAEPREDEPGPRERGRAEQRVHLAAALPGAGLVLPWLSTTT